MPTRRTPPTPTGETTRERVLRVAAELFAATSYDSTGVQEITEAAGIGRGALYHHIRSKQDLLHEIITGFLTAMIARAAAIVDGPGDAQARLKALAEDLVANLASSRDAWVVSMRDWRALSDERRAEVARMRDAYGELWQRVLDEGYAEGVLNQVDPALRRGILGMFTHSYLWVDPRGAVEPADVADRSFALILNGLRRSRPRAARRVDSAAATSAKARKAAARRPAR